MAKSKSMKGEKCKKPSKKKLPKAKPFKGMKGMKPKGKAKADPMARMNANMIMNDGRMKKPVKAM